MFVVLYRMKCPEYFAEMFTNVCQNFLVADRTLRADIDVLLDITKQLSGNEKVIDIKMRPSDP